MTLTLANRPRAVFMAQADQIHAVTTNALTVGRGPLHVVHQTKSRSPPGFRFVPCVDGSLLARVFRR